MRQLAAEATQKVLARLVSAGRLRTVLAGLSESAPDLQDEQFINVALKPDVAEKHLSTAYPLVLVYCTKLINRQTEKFRGFSGEAEVTVELRVSAERLDGLTEQLYLLADGVAEVLQAARGDWDDGAFYGGGYEIAFTPLRTGGRGFVQEAKVELALGMSAN